MNRIYKNFFLLIISSIRPQDATQDADAGNINASHGKPIDKTSDELGNPNLEIFSGNPNSELRVERFSMVQETVPSILLKLNAISLSPGSTETSQVIDVDQETYAIIPNLASDTSYIFEGIKLNSKKMKEAETRKDYLDRLFSLTMSVEDNTKGFKCFIFEQPGIYEVSDRQKPQSESTSDQDLVYVIDSRNDPLIKCTKEKRKISGSISVRPRAFEFYSVLVFDVKVMNGDKIIEQSLVNVDLEGISVDLSKEVTDPVAFEFDEGIDYGQEIQIRATSLTSDYYVCKIDKSEGTLYQDLSIKVECSPRSKKYDKLFSTAIGFMVIFLLSFVGVIVMAYKNSRK